jgi:hypothetical protein
MPFFSRRDALFWLCLFIGVIAFFHARALVAGWYWRYPWFDIPMHFFGGAWVALAARWGFARAGSSAAAYALRHPLRTSVGITLLTASAWELFEYGAGFVVSPLTEYYRDTAFDLFLGVVGAFVGLGATRSLGGRRRDAPAPAPRQAAVPDTVHGRSS